MVSSFYQGGFTAIELSKLIVFLLRAGYWTTGEGYSVLPFGKGQDSVVVEPPVKLNNG